MALKDTLSGFIDNTGLAEVFSRKPHDPSKDRKPLLDGIARTREQFKKRDKEVSKAPNKWWQLRNGVVALTVKVKGDTFDINGVATNHMPEERFEEFLTAFEKAVNAGEFDEELGNKGNGDAKVHISKAKGTRAPSSDPLTGLRRSVGKSLSNGRPLDEIEAQLLAGSKYDAADVKAVIAERKAAGAK
ncbi:hypothetical protein [uncultured Novosphingobium sp.]|uniref:hypothetical protein n=1 Tax=uncultured Novosphingobium sp. TaxID=292277 RepID=UPI00258664C4|nr:hypothetical protein [uncultured Novosphingobium sp.]